MQKRIWLTCVVVAALSIFSFSASAQWKTKREYSGFFDSYYYRGPINFTLGFGPSLYHGDYATGFYGSKMGISIFGGANYKVWPRCVYGVQFRYTTLGSKYSDSSFVYTYSGSHMGLDLYGRFYLLDDIVRKSKDRNKYRKGKIYLNYGVSIIRYSRIGFSLPLGIGYSYDINSRLSLHGGFTHHFMLSDNLDGLKKGGPDGYAIINFTVQYTPWGPKPKKKMNSEPPAPNPNRQEHQEWRKKKEKPKPIEEEPLPGEGETNPDGEQNPEGENQDQPNEEQPPAENQGE